MTGGDRAAARMFAIAGWLLIVLGAIHLAVVPLVSPWFAAELAPGSPRLPAVMLDHVVAGVLLLPLGGLTVYAAREVGTGARWARVVCAATAATVATFPILVVALMGREHLAAWPFALAVIVMAAAAVLLVVGVVRVARAARRR